MATLNKREFLTTRTVFGVASISASSVTVVHASDLQDDRFVSDSGWNLSSQVIHHGERNGYQVTRLSLGWFAVDLDWAPYRTNNE